MEKENNMLFTPEETKQEIINSWMDSDKLVALEKNPQPWSCENGPLFTATFFTLCSLLKILTDQDVEMFAAAIDRCWRRVDNKIVLGLMNRNPGRDMDLEQHDNNDGVSALSYKVGESLHKFIYKYGKSHFWIYNNVNPGKLTVNGKFTFRIFRLPHQVAFYKMLNGEFGGILGLPWLLINFVASTFGEGTSGKIINWLRLEALGQHSGFFRVIKKWYLGRLKKKFKGPLGDGMIEVFRIYYKDHPMTQLAKHYFSGV